jgi:hypothetical protein
VLAASARIYLLPVAGLLAGAGLAQLAATALLSPAAGGNAAGMGGIAGALLAVLLGRNLANRAGAQGPPLPRIVAIVADPERDDPPRVDAPGSPRVE